MDGPEPARRSEIRRSVVDQFDLGERMFGMGIARKTISNSFSFRIHSFNLQACCGGRSLNSLLYELKRFKIPSKKIEVVRVTVVQIIDGEGRSTRKVKWFGYGFLGEKRMEKSLLNGRENVNAIGSKTARSPPSCGEYRRPDPGSSGGPQGFPGVSKVPELALGGHLSEVGR